MQKLITDSSSSLSLDELASKVPFKSFDSYYKLGKPIGEGGFGIVFEVERLTD